MKYYILFFIGLISSGCGQNAVIETELFRAKTLMRSQPDSSLAIIREIDPDKISKRSTRARYSLLYSQALDKNFYDTDNDSLIRIAYRYYDKRIYSDSLRFLLNYHYGRIFHNAEDYPVAIHYYLTAEQFALSAKKNYYLGLLYTRMGEVYSEQMNYHKMLEYHKHACEYFGKLKNPLFKNNALVQIANAHLRLKDYDSATLYYTEAIELAKQRDDDELVSICLSNMGTAYAAARDYKKVRQTVKEIEKITPEAMSTFEYILLAESYFQQHKLDSAKLYVNLSRENTDDIRDKATLALMAFQIEMADEDYENAIYEIEDYINLSDSISRRISTQSATAAEGRYYKEQSAFNKYRLKMHILIEIITSVLLCVIIGFVFYYYRQRVRQKQVQVERYMSALDDLCSSKERVMELLTQKEGVEVQLKGFVFSRFDILDQLGRAFYERDNTKSQQEAIYKQVKGFFASLSSDSREKQQMEAIINTVDDNILIKLREQFPKLKSADIDLLSYIYAGFSAQIISVLTDDSVPNVYNRKSRIKARIAASDAPDKEDFLRKIQ